MLLFTLNLGVLQTKVYCACPWAVQADPADEDGPVPWAAISISVSTTIDPYACRVAPPA
jgi:hypothetical protein